MARLRSIASVVAVGLVIVAFTFAVRSAEPVEESTYDYLHERTLSMQAFIDAAPPGWSVMRARVPPPGGGRVFIASVELPDPCRGVGQSITCDCLPSMVLPPGGVIRDSARDLLAPTSPVAPPLSGDDLVVNGYRTKLVRVIGGACSAIGANETVTIVIPTLGDWIGRTTVVACLRGPGLADLEAELLALIEGAAR